MEPISYRLKLAALEQLRTQSVSVKFYASREKTLKKKASLKKVHDNPKAIFGLPLEALLLRCAVTDDGLRVPKCLSQIAALVRASIHSEGLFRVCGSAVRMRAAQAIIDGGGDVSGSIHDVTGLLKQFLRDLPEPLFTYNLYPHFVQSQQLPGPHQRQDALLLLCLLLPDAHLQSAKFLLHLLYDVVHAPGSLMSASNLAAIFTPNILKPRDEHGAVTIGQLELQNHGLCVAAVEYLIENYSLVGTAPTHVIRMASEYPDEEEAREEFTEVVSGTRSWFRNPFKSRRGKRKTMKNLSSATTLHLLKTSARPSENSIPGPPQPSNVAQPSPLLKHPAQPSPLLKHGSQGAGPLKAGPVSMPLSQLQADHGPRQPAPDANPAEPTDDVPEAPPAKGFDSFMMY
eukprot:m.233992 g.233992  ORF g.233992 m.233992 type:complete len:401 (-) comp12600_c0_seq1:1335-2537(-)